MKATATAVVHRWSKWNNEAEGFIRMFEAVVIPTLSPAYQNAEIGRILWGAEPHAEFFAVLYARLLARQEEFPAAGTIAREFVLPHLTAVAATQQIEAANKQLRAANASLWAAVILGSVAVLISAAQLYVSLHAH